MMPVVFYFYIRRLISLSETTRKDFWHFIFPLFVFCVNTVFVLLLSGESKTLLTQWYMKHSMPSEQNYFFINNIFDVLISLQVFFYIYLLFKIRKKHDSLISTHYSDIENKRLYWLNYLFWIFFASLIAYVVLGNIENFIIDTDSKIVYFSFQIVIMAFIFTMGIKQESTIDSFTNDVTNSDEENIISEEETTRLLQLLESYMKQSKPFLNHELRITELAKALQTNRAYLSFVINETYQMNFYNYINQFRIEEFISIYRLNVNKNLTYEAIAEKAGFKTKSSFYTAFKKLKGQTPAKYLSKTLL